MRYKQLKNGEGINYSLNNIYCNSKQQNYIGTRIRINGNEDKVKKCDENEVFFTVKFDDDGATETFNHD